MNYVQSFDLFGVPAKQIPATPGSGAPTATTEGAVGCLYMDTDTGALYKCTAVADGVYTWVEAGNGSGGNVDQTTAVTTADINIKKWFGKKIVVDGSSITTGGTGLTQPTWSDFLKDMFALSAVYNHASSGTPWFTYGATNVMSRTEDYETDADAIIIMGDYNGIASFNVDNPGTLDDEPSLTGTYYAKLKYLAETLINKFPLCPVIWVVEPPRYTGEGDTRVPMVYNGAPVLQGKAIEEVAEYYGFIHCNLMKNTIFRPWNAVNYAATTSDGVHPWNNVQRTMAQVIAETMKRTPLFYNESYVVTPDTSGDSGGTDEETGADTTKELTSITATFSQGDAVIKTTDDLSVLAQYLSVKAIYSDLSEATLSDTAYTLSGELTEGTSTITVTYGTATTTFTVEVTLDDGSVTVQLLSLLDESKQGAYFGNVDGNTASYSGVGISTYLSVKPNTSISLSTTPVGGLGGLTPHDVVYYDSDKNALSLSSNLTNAVQTVTVPDNENIKYFRICMGLNDEECMITYTPA